MDAEAKKIAARFNEAAADRGGEDGMLALGVALEASLQRGRR